MIEPQCLGTICRICSAWETYLTVLPWGRIVLKLSFPLGKQGFLLGFVVTKNALCSAKARTVSQSFW